ncbi:unnamed protein product [Mycena citricolor]|uniref:Uncharacterized protein n=1 Tax=Mycena citricolor TaxID=2018698 RepID=A0AAD2K5H0_9AGAR|nr:unnamed protein product [Mycena citricolor]CAK5279866.1 unnamed protein product [Mycena citricolor]
MKTASIFLLGALVASAAARPAHHGHQGKGSKSSSAVPSASSSAVVSAASGAASSAAVSATSSAAAAASSAAAPPANNAAAVTGAGGLQAATTLDPSVVCTSFTNDGQNPPVAGQTASLTTTNNFINFCALTLPGTPLTNGLQVTTGSCNPAPMGLIPSVDNMPSAKFVFPKNNGSVQANTAFTAQLAVHNFQTGVFTNAQKTYFSSPQRLNTAGQIIGHTHIVIEALTAIDQTEPTDPTKFVFFKGVDNPDVGGIASAAVTAGVPAGSYRVCSINSSSNHQPVLGPVAQHGSFDDCSYFTAA